jgi:hypothetical protein
MNDQEIDLVRRARPVDPPHDPAVRARAWARLHAEFDAPPRRRRLGTRAGWRPVVIGVVAAGAAAAVAATLIGGTDPARSPAPGVGTTAKTLELAAQTVEQNTAVPRPRPNQWVYSQLVSAHALTDGDVAGADAMLHGKVKVEEWWRFDGTAMASSVQNGKLYVKGILGPKLRPRPGHVDPRFNGGFIGGPAIVDSTPHKLYDYVAGLPADPDALLARVRRDYHDKGRDVTTIGIIYRIFRDDHLIPPKANAALYRALAKIPNVRVVNNTADFAGRRGIGVVFDTGEKRNGNPLTETIVLNSRNYRYMGDETQAVLASSVVDKAGGRS